MALCGCVIRAGSSDEDPSGPESFSAGQEVGSLANTLLALLCISVGLTSGSP